MYLLRKAFIIIIIVVIHLLQTMFCRINRLSGITACTVVQAVVKANSQSNGKGQISTTCLTHLDVI